MSYLFTQELVLLACQRANDAIMDRLMEDMYSGGHAGVGSLDGEFWCVIPIGTSEPITKTICESKLEISIEHRKPTDEVPLALRRQDQTIFDGSVVNLDFGFAVSFSGAEEPTDKDISGLIAAELIGLLAKAQGDLREVISRKRAAGEKIRFLGDEVDN